MNTTRSFALCAVLMLLMATTRSHHFDTLTHLPDASLAVFLLAGMYLPIRAFPALLVVAGLTDYVAIHYAGVSDFCVTPAYYFLIPTYAVLFYAGRFYAARHRATWGGLAQFAGIAFVATSIAFVISSGSFFLFSDRFAEMSALQYASRVAQYYAPYLISAFLYLSMVATAKVISTSLARPSPQNRPSA